MIGAAAIFAACYRRDIRTPSVLYSGFWLAVLLLYSFRLFGLYDTADRPFVFIMIGCTMFCLGGLGNKIIGINSGRYGIEYYFSERGMTILFLVSSGIFLRQNLFSLNSILRGTSFHTLRYGGVIQTSYIEDLIVKFIARPFATAMICISIAELLLGKRREKRHLIMALILCLQSMLFDGAMVMFEFLVTSVFLGGIIVIGKRSANMLGHVNKRDQKKTIVIALAVAFIGLYIAKGSIFKTIYMHFVPSVIYLEERLKVLDAGRLTNDIMSMTYGFTVIQGFIRPIMGVLEIAGIHSALFESATGFLLDNHDFVINIADNEYFNFYTTSYAFYYKDLGFIGIIVFPYLFGFICNQLYLRIKYQPKVQNISFYLLIVSAIILTIKASFFATTEFIVAIYWMILCMRKKVYPVE